MVALAGSASDSPAAVIAAVALAAIAAVLFATLAWRELRPSARRARAARRRPHWHHHHDDAQRPRRILIVGGGQVGLQTAYRLQKKLRHDEAVITVIDPHARLTYLPFLPEAAAGSIEPRHVVVSLHRVLHSCEIITGHVSAIDHARRTVTIHPSTGPHRQERYDVLVVAAGSIVRTMALPGLAEQAIGLKSLTEAIYLRDHVLQQLEIASSTTDAALRRKALTFVGVGGGFAGVEGLAELEDMARDAIRFYPSLRPDMMRWVLVQAGDRLMPELSPAVSDYTVKQLHKRRIDVRLNMHVTSMANGHIQLSDGESFDAATVLWTAGVRANPLAERTDLPLDDRGRIVCTPTMQVDGVDDAWAAGDIAAVPDLTVAGQVCAPTAQHAIRQAKRLADNIARSMRNRRPAPYKHKNAGSVASLGLHKGVAEVYGIKLRGLPAWLMHRTYHVSRMPTADRRLRILLDWTLAMFFHRDIVSLSDSENPRQQFREAARAEMETHHEPPPAPAAPAVPDQREPRTRTGVHR
jgi:NADH:ubiquinone reductase (H+-translocating)